MSEEQEDISAIYSYVEDFFGGDKAKVGIWLETPNLMLGGVSPKEMIRLGRHKKLLAFLNRARRENDEAEIALQKKLANAVMEKDEDVLRALAGSVGQGDKKNET